MYCVTPAMSKSPKPQPNLNKMVLSLVRYDFRHHLYITFVTSRLVLVAYFALMNSKYFHTTHFLAPGRSYRFEV
jgi:hypothetical protein